uniref:Dynactin subunit 4 n=1 Tax=Meloidogyne incognita TaxID=6306 RepID=A0A914KIK3_MELIC
MTSLLQSWLVKYKCNCSAWFPLCQMHYCRKCSRLGCPVCVIEEIDIVFCPNCLENVTNIDNQQRRFRCKNCYECPVCGHLLGIRSQGDQYHHHCNACKWTSKDLDIPENRTNEELWPELKNPLDKELGRISELIKELSKNEKSDRERKAQTTKRLSNLGILQNDRYGLQGAYNLRKKALEKIPETKEPLILLSPSADVPELDPSLLTEPIDPGNVPNLSQSILHLITDKKGKLHPLHVKTNSRRILRCVECENIIYRGEFSPKDVKPKLQLLASDFFPEIRISRQVELVSGQNSVIFLAINNNTIYSFKVKLIGKKCENDGKCVDTSNCSLELLIPDKDNSETQLVEIKSEGEPKFNENSNTPLAIEAPNETSSRVLYVSKNRAGVCVECLPQIETNLADCYALFSLSFTPTNGTFSTCTVEIKIFIGKALSNNKTLELKRI